MSKAFTCPFIRLEDKNIIICETGGKEFESRKELNNYCKQFCCNDYNFSQCENYKLNYKRYERSAI